MTRATNLEELESACLARPWLHLLSAKMFHVEHFAGWTHRPPGQS